MLTIHLSVRLVYCFRPLQMFFFCGHFLFFSVSTLFRGRGSAPSLIFTAFIPLKFPSREICPFCKPSLDPALFFFSYPFSTFLLSFTSTFPNYCRCEGVSSCPNPPPVVNPPIRVLPQPKPPPDNRPVPPSFRLFLLYLARDRNSSFVVASPRCLYLPEKFRFDSRPDVP